MSNLIEHISVVNEKLQLLIKQHQSLQKENSRLKQELELCRINENNLREKADQLQQQVEIARLTPGHVAQDVKMELEKRINTYIKEIDQCLALLVNQ